MIKKISAAVLSFVVFNMLSCTPSRQYIENAPGHSKIDSAEIKIQIVKGAQSVKISSNGKFKLYDPKTDNALYQGEKKSVTIYPAMIKNTAVAESWEGVLSVDDMPYRGRFILYNIVGRIHVINLVKMDDYLMSVVPSEMSVSWPDEALKSQAISARTYAYYHMQNDRNELFDLDSTTSFQVYKGTSVENEKTSNAVKSTSGIIASYGNKPILSFFHSTCGGHTTGNQFVWSGQPLDYLQGVKCNYCRQSPYYKWNDDISLTEMSRILKYRFPTVGRITGVSFKKHDGRVFETDVTHTNGTIKLTGNEFRSIFDPSRVRSLMFATKKNKSTLHLSGQGWGHGVGLCQFGAKGLAASGKKYDQILEYYYPGVQLIRFRN